MADPRPTDAAQRLPSTAPPRPGLVRCDSCGTANSPTRGFCQRCGARLPRVGASPPGGRGRVVRPPNGALLLGVVALLGLLAVGAFVVTGGQLGRLLGPGASASATLTASSPRISPSASVGPGASRSPAATRSAAASPSRPPGATPRPRFACSPMRVTDRSTAQWTIDRTISAREGRADVLTIQLERGGTRPEGRANVSARLVPLGELAGMGLAQPSQGDIALVLTFRGVDLGTTLAAAPNLRALREFRIAQQGNRVVAVVGVEGQGCYGIRAPAWGGTAPGATGQILVEIRNR